MRKFDAYTRAVVTAFEKTKKAGGLDGSLLTNQRGDIRSLCVRVSEENLSEEDLITLQKYFGSKLSGTDLSKYIGGLDTDYFKAFQNLLLGKVKGPKSVNVELLALLIDFEPRPIQNWEPDHLEDEKEEIRTEPSFQAADIRQEPKPKKRLWKYLGLGSIPLVVGYFAWQQNEPEDCMRWQEDRYIPCACADLPAGSAILRLDEQKVEQFRKILQPDSLHYEDVKKIWYAKTNQEVEFFTGPGFHPLHPERPLKLATRYIIQKYVIEPQQVQDTLGQRN